jgi:protein involved in polysaccharide export with SLBB domain
MLKYLLLLTLLFSIPVASHAQTPNPTQQVQLEAYLANRDIDEAELRTRLLAEGIDVDNMSQAQLIQARPQIEAIITTMEQEKLREAELTGEDAASSADNTQDEVDDAAVEEDVDEVIAKNDSLSLIYGHQIFRNRSLELYQATENATPPNSYPLKSGDEIGVTIFGASQEDLLLRVSEGGFVTLPNRVRILLAGVALGDARKLLADRLKNYYAFRDGQLSIRVQVARTISISILGEVENNGSFNISALNTGFNALVAAGGPTERGSVRNIQLVRGEETTVLDVYEYLRNPLQKTNLFLNDNASIYVPLAEKIVTLEGGVLRPMQYELKDGEGIKDLLDFAGNAVPEAETSLIQVTRYLKGMLEVINVDLATEPDFALVNGDVVSVPVIENPIEDFVTIEGTVLLPGRYSFEEGIDVGSLLDKGQLRPSARTDVAFLFRSNDDGTSALQRLDLGADAGAKEVKLKRGDVLRILSQRAFNDDFVFSVSGAVRDTAVVLPFPKDGALSLEEAILLAGGTYENAASEVMLIRTPLANREDRKYKRLDLVTDADFQLQPLDEVFVYPNERFADSNKLVSITGAVREDGSYVYDPSLSLRDLIYLSGGLTISAARNRVEIFRLSFVNGAETRTLQATLDLDSAEANDFELQAYDEVVVRNAAEFENIQNVVLKGEVRYPGLYALLKDNEKLSDLVTRAGGMTNEAFAAGATLYRAEGDKGDVILDLQAAVDDVNAPGNMVMRRGDTLYVPKRQDLVTIFLPNTISSEFKRDSLVKGKRIQVAYQGPKPANWYIKRYAGGFDDDTARRRWTTVQYASGQIRETSSFAGVHNYPKVLPGATIRVPAKPEKIQKTRREERFNWLGLAQIVVGAATTLTTFILIRN